MSAVDERVASPKVRIAAEPFSEGGAPRRADQLGQLMNRYAKGEDGVFEELYRLLAPRVYRFCSRLALHQQEADDCFQETLLRIHRARATYLEGADTLPWAFAIARSVYLDRLRYRRRRPEDLGSANDVAEEERLHADVRYSPEAAMRARDLQELVTLELSRMSEKNRVAYVLVKEEGLSIKETAAVLGTTAAVVRQRAHRAYTQLRTALRAAGWPQAGDDASSAEAPTIHRLVTSPRERRIHP
jgi:RNA polymerase sigma-70 factor (ECF subfamily)